MKVPESAHPARWWHTLPAEEGKPPRIQCDLCPRDCKLHDMGAGHPECPERIDAIEDRLLMTGVSDVLDRRDKIGFATPEQAWLISMADTVRGWLREDLRLPFFNQAQVLREFELIIAGKKAFSWQVWRWINFCRWYGHFIA